MIRIILASTLEGFKKVIDNQFGQIEDLRNEVEILKTTLSRRTVGEDLWDEYSVAVYNGAKELKLLHQLRLDVIKDKKGPKAVMEANENFNRKFMEFMDFCMPDRPTRG